MIAYKSQVVKKADIVGITYGLVTKQILKISKTKAEANTKLFKLGEEIGLRIADEYVERETNSYKPDQQVTVLLRGLMKQYLAIQVDISSKEIKYQKTKFIITFQVSIKDNPVCDFVILPQNGSFIEGESELNYNSIIEGFVSGSLKSMCYHPTITTPNDPSVLEVHIWKEKEQD